MDCSLHAKHFLGHTVPCRKQQECPPVSPQICRCLGNSPILKYALSGNVSSSVRKCSRVPTLWRASGRNCSLFTAAAGSDALPSLPSPPPAFANIAVDGQDLDTPSAGFDSIDDALEAIGRGELVVVLDDEDRENEGDLILAADTVTPQSMAFLVKHTSGVVCIGMEGKDLDRLQIPLMVPPKDNEEFMSTAFTVTVDLREGTSTGISAADRSATIRALADPSSKPADFKRPGHIFPLRYRPGGVLTRPGHTEASVDLARLANRYPAGVLCEIVNPDGSMARTPQLLEFASEHGLKCITIADLVRYRLKHETMIERLATGQLPTRYGNFTAYVYRSLLDGNEHMALVAGTLGTTSTTSTAASTGEILARIHSESMLGDVFGSERCDSGSQLDAALSQIAKEGCGLLVYLRGQQGRGLGLADELRAYTVNEQEGCLVSTEGEENPLSYSIDGRDYGVAAHILKDLGVTAVRLLTNNPAKVNCLKAHGIQASQLPLLPSSLSQATKLHGRGVSGRNRNGVEPHFV